VPAISSIGWFIRAPEKFDGYLWLVLVMLGVLGAALLLRKNQSKVAIALVLAIPMLAFASALPKNLAGFADKYVPIAVPREYYQVAQELAGMPGATLWLAPYYDATLGPAGNLAYSWAPDRFAPSFVRDSLPGNTFAAYHYTDPFTQEYAYLYTHPEDIGRKLAALGIANIVLADDLVGGHAGFVRLQEGLAKDPSIVFLNKVGSDLFVYRRTDSPGMSLDHFILVQGGRASQEIVYSPAYLDVSAAHLIYAEQQPDPSWVTDPAKFGGLPWLLDNRSETDVAMDKFVGRYGISFTDRLDNSELYGGWGRTLTAMPTSDFAPWHSYLSQLLGLSDPWDFDFERGVVFSASSGVAVRKSRVTPVGHYELMVRALTSPDSSTLRVSLDGLTRYVPLGSPTESSLRWFDLGQIALTKPSTSVTIYNGTQQAAVNMVALVPQSEFQDELGRIRSLFQSDGLSVVLSNLTRQPTNQYLAADTYKISGQDPVSLIDLAGQSVLSASHGVVAVAHPGQFAVARTTAQQVFAALTGPDWSTGPAATAGFASSGSGSWRETQAPSDGRAYIQSRSFAIPAGCQSLVVAGTVDLDRGGDFSSGVQFLSASGVGVGTGQTVSGKRGSLIGLNIGGVVPVPTGASRVVAFLQDRDSPGAEVRNPVLRMLCGTWVSQAATSLSLAGVRGSQSHSSALVHDAAYDPQWIARSQSGGQAMPGVPVDGAITLFPGGRAGDSVVYAPDETLATGWRLTAFGSGLLLALSLLIGWRKSARRWLSVVRGKARSFAREQFRQ
jgi:hypothetical protein